MKVFYKNKITETICKNPDNHFRYGTGVFETLLYDGAALQNMQMHLDRLCSSSEAFGYKTEAFDYSQTAEEVIAVNGLTGVFARVNICHIFENAEEASVFVSAAAYTPPPEDKVFSLCAYPYVHDSYMSRYKTMNYMHFLNAKRYASEKGCDDALLVDTFGNVLETSAAALVFFDGTSYFVPKSENRLPSIAQKRFVDKYGAQKLDIKLHDIDKYEITVMNSLMGARKAEIRPE